MSTAQQTAHCPMATRTMPAPDSLERMSTEEIRQVFGVRRLFVPGEMHFVYTGLDRLVIGGIMPDAECSLPCYPELGARYFAERREIGILNVGAPGFVAVAGRRYCLEPLDCIYIGKGAEEIRFERAADGPPAFYLCSSPAHAAYPTALLRRSEAAETAIGDPRSASSRRIVKYICPGAIPSCQLTMGVTELDAGSVWNTMPPHTHSRRSEVYLYFDLGPNVVFHLLGTPGSTRHLVLHDREAALAPGWSIHAGAGTGSYRFVWAMAGENQDFADIDLLSFADLA